MLYMTGAQKKRHCGEKNTDEDGNLKLLAQGRQQLCSSDSNWNIAINHKAPI